MTTIAMLTEAMQLASKSLDSINEEMNDAIRAETLRLREAYRERRRLASIALTDAQRAVEAAKIAEANNHPLIGKKVSKTITEAYARGTKTRDIVTFGIVEVMAPGVEMPGNVSHWRLPNHGEVFVRLLKADGKPGLKIENLHSRWVEAK